MALAIRGAIEQLARAVLGMPLEHFAQREARTDAADGDGPTIPGGDHIVAAAGQAIAGLSGNVADKVERNSRTEFKRLGIDLRQDEPKFGKLIEDWRSENVDRAKSLVSFEREKLSEILAKGENKTVAELRGRIQERLDVSRSKADLLARDQVLKLNAKITRERQQAAGITDYIWTTSNDERVRETHDELDGETFSWDDPPVTNEAGDRNHPGEDYQCRCVAYPVLPELGEGDDDAAPQPEAEPEAPAPDEDLAPPAEPPLVERGLEVAKALANPGKNGAVIRDVLRQQVKALLPEAVSQDESLGRPRAAAVKVDTRTLQKLGANAVHGFDGEVTITRDVADNARLALAQHAVGGSVTAQEKDAVRTLLHEEMHGHSRVSPRSYRGLGAKLEEVGTELNARRLAGDVFGAPVNVGSYQAYIDQVRGVIRNITRAAGNPLLEDEADKLIAEAHVKAACSGGPLFETPEEAARAFAFELDVPPAQRALILQGLKQL
ncbi:MAG TPA: minor capsid protein [Casimicrobiaceae bacterium]|nr:minor capsid protein [Casimicrobiaceae bacterium]